MELHSPTQVYFFHMGEESLVKSAQFAEHLTPDQQTGASGPENVLRSVVLPMVFLKHCQHPASAEGIAESVDVSACSSGIFEFFLFLPAVQFRSTGTTVRMRIHPVYQRLQPSFRNFYV